MTIIKTESPAKINLTLEVIRKMNNGFHELRSVMLKLFQLKDELEFQIKTAKTRKIIIKCDNPEIPLNEKNICHKATMTFLNKLDKDIEILIKIKKRIPIGAGLGGGSSDAASTFLVLNDYFKRPFSKKQLIEMATEVGKDVPFFFSEKRGALIGGAGEKIIEEFNFEEGCFLMINPRIQISTPEAFNILDEEVELNQNKGRANVSRQFLNSLKNGGNFEKYFYNDFEIFADKKYPIIGEIKKSLLEFGARGALMTGSGSTVFGWFEDFEKAEMAREFFQNKYKEFLVVIG